jgi:hypothetical protein
MVEFDFDGVESTDYQSIPPGTYVCRVDDVRTGSARDGSERWSLKWVVDRGSFAGRFAAWDNLTFNERAGRRVKLVLGRLGIPSTGKVRIDSQELVGRKAVVTLVAGEWTNEETGERVLRNQVPWDGYRELPLPEEPEPEASSRAAGRGAGGGRQAHEGEGIPF